MGCFISKEGIMDDFSFTSLAISNEPALLMYFI